jgi:DNA-binding MltR family transcriptional regulator
MRKKQIPFQQLTADESEIYKALHFESDIICVVIGAAFLDVLFDILLRKNMLTSKVTDKLLSGALSDFRARTDLLYCLSLIEKEPYRDAVTIAEIRNRFSHSHLKLGFEDATITKLWNQLKGWSYFHGEENITPRRKFVLTVIRLVAPLKNYLEIVPAFVPKFSPLSRVYSRTSAKTS